MRLWSEIEPLQENRLKGIGSSLTLRSNTLEATPRESTPGADMNRRLHAVPVDCRDPLVSAQLGAEQLQIHQGPAGPEKRLLSSVICFHVDDGLDAYLRQVDVSSVIADIFPDIDTRPPVSSISNEADMLSYSKEVNAADGGHTAVIVTDTKGAMLLATRLPRIGYRVSDSRQQNTEISFPNTLYGARYLLRHRPLQVLIVPTRVETIVDSRSDALDPSYMHHLLPGKQGLSNALFRLLVDAAAMQERIRLLGVLMQNEEIICNFNEELSRQTAALSYANARLSEMAMTDPLTGKYNRRYFKRRYGLEVERSHRAGLPLSVLMIDIDYFKRYNDVNGHVAGDAVLRQVADLIGQERRVNDVIARYGGEEFVVLLPDTPKWAAIQLAERMRSRVFLAPFSDGDTHRNQIVSVSIGVATCPDDTIVADELIQIADKGLYEAKRLGRNRVEPGRAIDIVKSTRANPDVGSRTWGQVAANSKLAGDSLHISEVE